MKTSRRWREARRAADPNALRVLPDPAPSETRYESWKEFSGIRFPTRRVKLIGAVNRGETATETLRVNGGLRSQVLSAKPADFAPEVARP